MNALKATTLLLFTLTVTYVSSSEDISSRIVGGSDATIEEFPYMAGIYVLGRSICSATILSPRSVLTAAHCVDQIWAPIVSVSVGSSKRTGEGGQLYPSLFFVLHPDFVNSIEPNFQRSADIAIVRTINRMLFGPLVQPIALGLRFVPSGAEVVLTGWGSTGGTQFSEQLQQLRMVSIANLQCLRVLRDSGSGRESQLATQNVCVVAVDGGACSGDSGSPILFEGAVVGVTSWFLTPCGFNPTVITRVAPYLSWIQSQLEPV